MEADDPEEWYKDIEVDLWKECYNGHKWDNLRCDESIGHPAKMANGLLEKVFKFLMSEGVLKFGDTILDPMGGIGSTAIGWLMIHPSNKAITVELEPKFVEFQMKNKALLEARFQRKVNWTIIQGDARKLSSILLEHGLVGVTSPPYITQSGGTNVTSKTGPLSDPALLKRQSAGNLAAKGYGDDPDNIGNCPDKPVVVSSPPYSDGYSKREGGEICEEYVENRKEALRKQGRPEVADKVKVQEYNINDPHNIGNCPDKPVIVSSPPYAETDMNAFAMKNQGRRFDDLTDEEKKERKDGAMGRHGYRNLANINPDQIANLPDKPIVVTSPPYENSVNQNDRANDKDARLERKKEAGIDISKSINRSGPNSVLNKPQKYGDEEGQIGSLKDKPVTVTSPPYADSVSDWDRKAKNVQGTESSYKDECGKSQRDNIGNIHYWDRGAPPDKKHAKAPDGAETYLEAMQSVYDECSKVCRAIVTVTKNPTRDKKLRRLDLDTWTILHVAGFKVTHWFHAQLFEIVHQATLDGGVKKEAHGRLSFFKRLHWNKGGIVADHEDIIVALKEAMK